MLGHDPLQEKLSYLTVFVGLLGLTSTDCQHLRQVASHAGQDVGAQADLSVEEAEQGVLEGPVVTSQHLYLDGHRRMKLEIYGNRRSSSAYLCR